MTDSRKRLIEARARQLIERVRNPHIQLMKDCLDGKRSVRELNELASVLGWSDAKRKKARIRLLVLSADYLLAHTLGFVEEEISDGNLNIRLSNSGDAREAGYELTDMDVLGAEYSGEASWSEKYGKPKP